MTRVAVVYTNKIQFVGEYVEVAESLNTPFSGPGALGRAKRFRDSEEDRGDFPATEGWVWHVWANDEAREEWAEHFTKDLFGEEG